MKPYFAIQWHITDAFCIAENIVLQATELDISSCIVSPGAETFANDVEKQLLKE